MASRRVGALLSHVAGPRSAPAAASAPTMYLNTGQSMPVLVRLDPACPAPSPALSTPALIAALPSAALLPTRRCSALGGCGIPAELHALRLHSDDLMSWTQGLGTFDATEPGEVKAAVKAAVNAGYRLIDCAAGYGNQSEVGEAISELIGEGVVTRDELFVVSKLFQTHRAAPPCPHPLLPHAGRLVLAPPGPPLHLRLRVELTVSRLWRQTRGRATTRDARRRSRRRSRSCSWSTWTCT